MIVFAHVSDLHFGAELANKTPGTIHQQPHSLPLCLSLPSAFMDARVLNNLSEDAPVNVVASGDLTVSGSAEEFAVAHTFLRSRPRIKRSPVGDYMGLAIADDRLGAVPGNHDHWRGKRGLPEWAKGSPAFTPSIFGTQFRPTPWNKLWVCPNNSVAVELFGVDSNSGFDPTDTNRRAKGSISPAELQGLERLLQVSANQSVQYPVARAIVCHHSVSYRGGLSAAGELDQRSRDKLISLAGSYRVAAILTGHTHDFNMAPFNTLDTHGADWVVHELRSASTVAINQKFNGFWLHRISLANGTCEWLGWRYVWDQTRFCRKQQLPCVNFRAS